MISKSTCTLQKAVSQSDPLKIPSILKNTSLHFAAAGLEP